MHINMNFNYSPIPGDPQMSNTFSQSMNRKPIIIINAQENVYNYPTDELN